MKTSIILLFILTHLTHQTCAQNEGNALHFNATNGYCSSNLPTVFNNISTNDFTIECWIQSSISSSSKRVFFAQKDANNYCSILINNMNIPYFFLMRNGTIYSVNTQSNLFTTQWNHIAFSWDASSNSITSFINGNQVTGISGGSSSTGNNDVMTIGSRSDGQQIFNGSIDELRIWDDIRTPCEIFAGMNNHYNTVQPNLIASYSFNQGVAAGANTGITTLTELNNNYNGTLNGFTLSGFSSNWVVSETSISQTNNNSETYYTSDVISSCGNYNWIDGNNYFADNNTAIHAYTSTNGCDSIILLNLTIDAPVTADAPTDVTACDDYILPVLTTGNYYSESNGGGTLFSAGHVISSSQTYYIYAENGTCNDENNFAITINNSTSSTDEHTSCDSFTWIDGFTYTTSNTTATHTLTNVNGCDSVITLNLTINDGPLNTVTVVGIVLMANETGASYQWLDCNNNNTPISGAISQSFTPDVNGIYAVEITKNGCSDTSDCINVANLDVNALNNGVHVTTYPNPSIGLVNLTFGEIQYNTSIVVTDSQGRVVSSENYKMIKSTTLELTGESGIYFIALESSAGNYVLKCVKE